MNYATPEAFRRALLDRISKRAKEAGVPEAALRKRAVFERFFARLAAVAPNRWVLKGALSPELRFGRSARATMDADIAVSAGTEELKALLARAARVDLPDFFEFGVSISEDVPAAAGEVPLRFLVTSYISGRVFDQAVLDAATAAHLPPDPERVLSSELAFAGLPPVEVPLLPLEAQVADKLHAYTRPRHGRPPTRVKDLVDLALIARSATLSADRLRRAVEEVFERAGTHPVPQRLPRPPAEWAVPYRRAAIAVGLDPDPESGWRAVSALVDPVLSGRARGMEWDPNAQEWVSPTRSSPP